MTSAVEGITEAGNWRKSSYSKESNCAEAGNWRKSSHSASGNCAETGSGGGLVAVRDTKQDGAGPVLTFTPAAWARFTAAVREDRAASG